MTDRRPLLRAIFDAAVGAAHPDVVLSAQVSGNVAVLDGRALAPKGARVDRLNADLLTALELCYNATFKTAGLTTMAITCNPLPSGCASQPVSGLSATHTFTVTVPASSISPGVNWM